jgi:hypothetical protein
MPPGDRSDHAVDHAPGVTPTRRQARWMRAAPSKSTAASNRARSNRSSNRRRSASRWSLRAPATTSMTTGSVTVTSSRVMRSVRAPVDGAARNV